jgi:1,4-dihydroxy-2-naphthoate octaprenyltransferase
MYALANPTDSILTPTEVFNWRLFGFAILTTLDCKYCPFCQ